MRDNDRVWGILSVMPSTVAEQSSWAYRGGVNPVCPLRTSI